MNYKMFGIPNCDSVKKVCTFFKENNVDYEFIDFKKMPPNREDILRWQKFFGDLPANKKGPTFRKIKDEYESSSTERKIEMLIENSSAIKRPIVEKNGTVVCIGNDEALLKKLI